MTDTKSPRQKDKKQNDILFQILQRPDDMHLHRPLANPQTLAYLAIRQLLNPGSAGNSHAACPANSESTYL